MFEQNDEKVLEKHERKRPTVNVIKNIVSIYFFTQSVYFYFVCSFPNFTKLLKKKKKLYVFRLVSVIVRVCNSIYLNIILYMAWVLLVCLVCLLNRANKMLGAVQRTVKGNNNQ